MVGSLTTLDRRYSRAILRYSISHAYISLSPTDLQVLVADVADPLCPPDVVLPAALADLGPAHLAEGAAVHDAAELCPAATAGARGVWGPHHRASVDAVGVDVGGRGRGGEDADVGAATLDLVKFAAETAEMKRKREIN
jgi:hypothetical protein